MTNFMLFGVGVGSGAVGHSVIYKSRGSRTAKGIVNVRFSVTFGSNMYHGRMSNIGLVSQLYK